MAPQQVDRITRIAMEGFALIEDSYGGPHITRRCGRLPPTHVYQHHHPYQYQQTLIYHGPQISTVRMPVITSNEVAQCYGPKMKEQPVIIARNEVAHDYGGLVKEPVITSDEAAEYYGGFVIVEHGKKKQFRSAH